MRFESSSCTHLNCKCKTLVHLILGPLRRQDHLHPMLLEQDRDFQVLQHSARQILTIKSRLHQSNGSQSKIPTMMKNALSKSPTSLINNLSMSICPSNWLWTLPKTHLLQNNELQFGRTSRETSLMTLWACWTHWIENHTISILHRWHVLNAGHNNFGQKSNSVHCQHGVPA